MSPTFPIEALRDSAAIAGDAEALRNEAAEQGYLFFRGGLDAERVRALRRVVLERCARRGWLDPDAPVDEAIGVEGIRLGDYGSEWVRLQQEVFPTPEFLALRREPFVLETLERLFGEPALDGRGETCRVMSPAARDMTTRPHQDRFYLARDSEQLWTVWVPLGDCPIELGGLAVLPGSHKLGVVRHSGEGAGRQGAYVAPDRVWATTDYVCGDVLMFSTLTLHRACENTTQNRLRLSADFRYVPASVGDLEAVQPLQASQRQESGSASA